MIDPEIVAACEGFDWDDANAGKVWRRHRVTVTECEEAFAKAPLLFADDHKHSLTEARYHAIGQTDAGRVLFMVFTLRKNVIRIISARPANRREREEYEV